MWEKNQSYGRNISTIGLTANPDPSFPIKNRWRPLDLSVPEVHRLSPSLYPQVVKEWGFDVLKCDFTYHVMSPVNSSKRI